MSLLVCVSVVGGGDSYKESSLTKMLECSARYHNNRPRETGKH